MDGRGPGNAPANVGCNPFGSLDGVTFFYLPGTAGWGGSFAGRPAVLWDPAIDRFGVTANGFGFRVAATADLPIVAEASTDLAGGAWVPLQSASLADGCFEFVDPGWTSHAARFYRIVPP
jgi:hypothetical protein